MIPLSRLLFPNSKNIGKHRVSLVLVEALYAIKSLDVLVLSRVTRSNSIGSQTNLNSSLPNPIKSNLDIPVPPKIPAHQQQVLETSYTPSKRTGPTFVYRFYCRGENDTYAYKLNLESALNDALLYFLSEYMTRIEPELYLKRIELKRTPVQFRKDGLCASGAAGNKSYSRDGSDRIKIKKRNKSTGSDEHSINHAKLFALTMNKTARNTSLGKLISTQKISSEQHLNQYVVNNLSSNLFDQRNCQETIEYFRENISSFRFVDVFYLWFYVLKFKF